MRTNQVSALLAAVGVLTIAGVGSSASPKQALVKMQDFVRSENVIIGGAGTEMPVGYFQRLEQTDHLPGIGGPNYPPNPCNAHISVYNKIIQNVPPGAGRLNATLSVLGNLARSQCCMEARWSDTENPADGPAGLISLQPRACGE